MEQPEWMPECLMRASLNALGVVLTLTLWPLVVTLAMVDAVYPMDEYL